METIWLSKLASFSSLFTSYKVGKMRPIPHSLILFIHLTQPFININYFTAIHHNVISIFFSQIYSTVHTNHVPRNKRDCGN